MCEVDSCFECGSDNILYDDVSGEVVCRDCGLVVFETVEYSAPADRVVKGDPSSPIAYTSAAVGTEIDSYQRLELKVAHDIDRVLQHIKFPKATKLLATNYVGRLRRSMDQQKDQPCRFSCTDLTAISIWTALKLLKYPLSYNEFSEKIKPFVGEVNLMKIEKRASFFIDNVPRVSDVQLVTAHIIKLVNLFESNLVISSYYASVLGKYAVAIVNAAQDLVKGHRPELVAASAVFAADSLIAECFTLRAFAEFVDVGAGNLSVFADNFKHFAPQVPKESAAIYFIENLFRRVF